MKLSRLISRLTALALTAVVLVGCGEEFLDREPIDQISDERFYRTFEDMQSATLAIYTGLQSQFFFGEGWRLAEAPSDDSRMNFGAALDNFSATAGNGDVLNYWSGHYRVITLANVVIDRAPLAEISATEAAAFVAEAKFLRAVSYFDLVRLFGDVPLVTLPPTLDQDLLLPRAPVAEVYDLIKADLREASERLPLTADNGRATSGAARAYLAMVHLTLREWQDARDQSLAVINSGVYELMPDYGDLWVRGTYDNNQESVFEVQYAGCESWGTGNMRQAFFAPWNQGVTKGQDGWGSLLPTDPALDNVGTTARDVWEDGDVRRHWSMMEPGNFYPSINAEDGGYTYPSDGAGGATANIKKYVMGGGSDVCFMSTPQNGSLMRYSEVLLIFAEAAAELTSGVSVDPAVLGAVNSLRTRAGVAPYDFIDRERLDLERRREFMFESKRWFDILRKGPERAVELMRLSGRTLDETRLVYPIPASELEINTNLVQNPGY